MNDIVKPMEFEDYWKQIMQWAKERRFDLIKLSAKKRREYQTKKTI
jgi:hypothetical protein